jgi:hypothetical protein
LRRHGDIYVALVAMIMGERLVWRDGVPISGTAAVGGGHDGRVSIIIARRVD